MLANLEKRPQFPNEEFVKWWKIDHCANGESKTCWCEPGKNGKCWDRHEKKAADAMDPMSPVMHILKGAEDSIGVLEAIQRVYINIGSCSETCWTNHLTNFFVVDPTQRNFGQTPFDIGQCRRECPNFRAVEDRLAEIGAFLFSQRPADLYAARGLEEQSGIGRATRSRIRRWIGQIRPATVRARIARSATPAKSPMPAAATRRSTFSRPMPTAFAKIF